MKSTKIKTRIIFCAKVRDYIITHVLFNFIKNPTKLSGPILVSCNNGPLSLATPKLGTMLNAERSSIVGYVWVQPSTASGRGVWRHGCFACQPYIWHISLTLLQFTVIICLVTTFQILPIYNNYGRMYVRGILK